MPPAFRTINTVSLQGEAASEHKSYSQNLASCRETDSSAFDGRKIKLNGFNIIIIIH